MSQITFDSHRFVKGAVETGFSEKQAEFLAAAHRFFTGHIATKEDIFGLGKRIDGLEQRIDRLEQRVDGLEQRMDRLEQRMDSLEQRVDSLEKTMWRIAVMQMGFISILFALIKIL